MLTHKQRKIFLIIVMGAMFVPMILIGFGKHIRQEIFNKRCPAIREVGEFQEVFNTYAMEYGLSIDLSETAWAPYSGHYFIKTVPVKGAEETLRCAVAAWGQANRSEVRAVAFYEISKQEELHEDSALESSLRVCFRVFAPSMYESPYAGYSESGLDYEGIVLTAKKKWRLPETEHYEWFISDHVSKRDIEYETLRIRSRITEDGKYEKFFEWS